MGIRGNTSSTEWPRRLMWLAIWWAWTPVGGNIWRAYGEQSGQQSSQGGAIGVFGCIVQHQTKDSSSSIDSVNGISYADEL